VPACCRSPRCSADTVDIASVEFFEGAASLGKVTATPFTFSWQAPTGTHQITAKATDTTLANATSMPVSFNVTDAAGGRRGRRCHGRSWRRERWCGDGRHGGRRGGLGGSAGSGAMAGGAAGAAPFGAGGAAGGSVISTTPVATSSSADSGCSCALPGSRARGGLGLALLGASLAALRGLGRRRAAHG